MGEQVQRPLQLFSLEKLEEFRDMSLKGRLQWLEDANWLACKVLGKTAMEQLAVTTSHNDMAFTSSDNFFDQILLQMKEQVLQKLRPEKLFLFGSRAMGTATKESDIDLMVVMETDLPPRKRNVMVKRLFPRRSFALDAFVYTPQEFHRYKDVPGTVVYQAVHHGKLLYG
jgi:predicted nucleotidyltransferase